MASLAWSVPVSYVALSMGGTRAAQRADTYRMRGAYGTYIRTQLYLECYCACRWRTRAATVKKRRLRYVCVFLGNSRTSRCLPVSGHMGCGAQSAMAGQKIKRWAPSWRNAVVQLVNWLGGRRRERFEFNRAAFGPSRGRADVSTADLATLARSNMKIEARHANALRAKLRRPRDRAHRLRRVL
jgi:hypothetical protein